MRNCQSATQIESLQRQEFGQELKRVNQQLSQALTAFEKRYSRRFLWKGSYILECVQAPIEQQLAICATQAAHVVLDKAAPRCGSSPPYQARSSPPASNPARDLRPVVP